MSKIAEKKALEAYPMVNPPYSNSDEPKLNVENLYRREGYIKGYDQAMQDMVKDSDYLKYLSDNEGYAYACGCKKTTQDFLEKAEEFFNEYFNIHPYDCHVVQYVSDTPLESIDDLVEHFKNYVENDTEI